MRARTFLLLALAGCTADRTEVAFTIPEPDLIPEGIAYDAVEDVFYLSSTYRRKVVRIDRDGSVRDFMTTGRDGLWGALGMEVDAARRVLWVASSHAGAGMPMQNMDSSEEGMAGVFKYDLTTGDLIGKYVLEAEAGEHFLNDLTVTREGTVYVTDSSARAVYRIQADSEGLELFIRPDGMGSPNGITLGPEEEYLFVALEGQIGKIHLGERSLSMITLPEGVSANADGLYFFDGSLVTVWPFSEGYGVTRYRLNPTLDTVTGVEPLLSEHPTFQQPTTGAIVDGAIYVVANGQLQLFRRMYEAGGAADRGDLKDPVILRVPLTGGGAAR